MVEVEFYSGTIGMLRRCINVWDRRQMMVLDGQGTMGMKKNE